MSEKLCSEVEATKASRAMHKASKPCCCGTLRCAHVCPEEEQAQIRQRLCLRFLLHLAHFNTRDTTGINILVDSPNLGYCSIFVFYDFPSFFQSKHGSKSLTSSLHCLCVCSCVPLPVHRQSWQELVECKGTPRQITQLLLFSGKVPRDGLMTLTILVPSQNLKVSQNFLCWAENV